MLRFPPQALVVEIEANQTKLDQCQINAKQYCTSVKVCICVTKQKRFYLLIVNYANSS